jgi:hypothetical protein
MAYATVKGQKYSVRVTQDLATNYSIEVFQEPPAGTIKRSEPYKPWPSPLCLKICADTREDALVFGLEHMKKLGQIDDFHVEPHERPAPPATAAPAKKSDDDEEAA